MVQTGQRLALLAAGLELVFRIFESLSWTVGDDKIGVSSTMHRVMFMATPFRGEILSDVRLPGPAWIELPPVVWLPLVAAVLVGAWVCVRYGRRIRRLEKHRLDHELFAARLLASQEQERKRMAADLHDGLGQNLILIKNRVVLALQARDREGTDYQLNEIARVAGESIEEMRKISRNLRPYQLDRLGLTKAMRALVKQAGQTSSIDFRMEIDQVDDLFTDAVEINLYRIMQEALTNVVKHSGATRAVVRVRRVDKGCDMMIEDNGRGFDAEPGFESLAGQIGMGLITIKERVRIVQGRLRMAARTGDGVRLELSVSSDRE